MRLYLLLSANNIDYEIGCKKLKTRKDAEYYMEAGIDYQMKIINEECGLTRKDVDITINKADGTATMLAGNNTFWWQIKAIVV